MLSLENLRFLSLDEIVAPVKAFWGIDELFLDPCCALKYYPEVETAIKEVKNDREAKEREAERKLHEAFGNSCVGRVRDK